MKKVAKNSWYLLCLACVLFSCTRNINHLNKQKVYFNELPLVVQDTLISFSNDIDVSWFIFFEKDKYDTKSLAWKRGPFTNGFMFTDKESGKKYKINQGIPSPYILYNDTLYHPIEFNLFPIFRKDIKNEVFKKYALN